jgi:hypothetical protein
MNPVVMIIQLQFAPSRWFAGAAKYGVNSLVLFLEVPWVIFLALIVITPGRVAGTTRPVTVIASRLLGVLLLGHTVGERTTLPGGVVRVLVPWTLAIQESV